MLQTLTIKDDLMHLRPPTLLSLLLSLICGVLALLPVFGIVLVSLPISGFWMMTIAWAFLLFGVLFRGL